MRVTRHFSIPAGAPPTRITHSYQAKNPQSSQEVRVFCYLASASSNAVISTPRLRPAQLTLSIPSCGSMTRRLMIVKLKLKPVFT